jgi:UDP-glucose 4-epimerase
VIRPICLVTGASGALGPTVVNRLARDYDVRTFSRRPPPADLFAAPVQAFTGDIADPSAVRHAAKGAHAIVHLAALLHVVSPSASMRAEYERINIAGTAAIVGAALAEQVARVVLLSTIAVYGKTSGQVVDESWSAAPDTLYGETKLAAEKIALEARRADGAPLSTVLRSAAVYGPGIKGNYRTLVDAIEKRRFIPIGPGTSRRTVVFDEDLAAAIELALTHEGAPGRIFNVSDGQLHELREIIAAIAAALHRQPPHWQLPVSLARLAASGAGLFDRRIPGMLDKYLEDTAVDATRIQRELGFTPAFDLHRGWTRTVQRIRSARPGRDVIAPI